MHRTTALLALTLGLAAGTSCLQTWTALSPDYCSGAQDGDSFCAEKYPDGSRNYCTFGLKDCVADIEDDIDGCVPERPADECYSPCGRGNAIADDTSCVEEETTIADASTSSGGETDSSSTTVEPETDTEEPSATTGPECSETVPCMGPAAPFCVDGACSTCDATAVPDESCATLDEALPLCVGTSCVQCTAEDSSACGGETPLCDAAINTCVGCSFHEECQDIDLHACNIATGACFSADAANVSEVDAGSNGAIQAAIGAVADGAEHTILLTGGGGNHTVTVDGGKTIAIVSDSAAEREVRGAGGNPTVTVTGAGSTVYLHRMELIANTDDVGISAEASGTLYADSTRVAQNTGGGITLAAGTSGFLRNCMVGLNGGQFASTTGIESAGELSILYSSIVANDGDGADSLQCNGGSAVVRNSILVGSDASSIDCSVLDASNSAFDEAVAGNENAGALIPGWFESVAGANFRLTAAGQTEFADIAIWEDGDPPFDFDGDTRPNTDGAMDYAGADTVP
ncbi:MAG: hypothetical protein ACRBN8_43810 [Nannocystales bacterium]